MILTDSERERYFRQLSVFGWNQEKLKSAKVLVLGVGGLGSVSSLYLTAAGVGKLRLCDGDRVSRKDLNRQILYSEESIGKYKVEEAKRRLSLINPDIDIEGLIEVADVRNINEIVGDCNLVVDGLDNLESRFVLNGQSVKSQIPYVYGAVQEWEGFVGLFYPPHTACLGCVMSPDVQKPDVIHVMGITPGTIGILQATEAIKFIMGVEPSLLGRLLVFDNRRLKFDIVQIEKNLKCLCCSV